VSSRCPKAVNEQIFQARGDRSSIIQQPSISDIERRLRRSRKLAQLLDAQFQIPGTPIRFGFDGLIGLIPGVGDSAAFFVSLIILYDAWRSGVGVGTLAHMLFNTGLDAIFGAIPLLGDLFDVWFKANQRNVRLFENAVGESRSSARTSA